MVGSQNRLVAVCGITGNQGNAVARELLAKGYAVRGLTRRPDSEKAAALSRLGAEMIRCNLNNTEDVQRALEGAWGAFGVFASMQEGGAEQEEKQAKRFAVIAKSAGVRHYVYSSVAAADRNTGISFFDNKARVEGVIRSLGLPSHTILRPAFFMENFQSPWMLRELERGRLSIALKPETRVHMVAVADIGRFGCVAFEKYAELDRAAINLAGDELTMPEAAEILSEALDRRVEFSQAPMAEVRKTSPDLAVMYEWFNNVGLGVSIPEITSLYGIRPLSFRQWARKVKWPVAAR